MNIGFEGHFKFVVSGGSRGEVTLAEGKNTITDIGLDRAGTGSIATWCRVGSGNRPSNEGDTDLQQQTGKTSSVTASTSFYEPGVPPRSGARRTFRFAKGAAIGTHSEVGVGWAETGDTLWSRSLIKDENGDILSITVLPDEILDVIYTLYMYLDLNDHVAYFMYKGVNRKATTRFSNVTQHSYLISVMNNGLSVGTYSGGYYITAGGGNSVLGDVYTNPTYRPNSANGGSQHSKVWSIYVNGSREREVTYKIPDTSNTSDNLFGVINVDIHWTGSHGSLDAKTQFEPPLEKNYTEEFTYTGKISWGRYLG